MTAVWLTSGLLAGIIVLLDVGRRVGARRLARDAAGARAGTGAVEGAIFALLGLLIAFTFSGAASRFDARRQLIVQEANNIGTAWLRLDLLPEAPRREVQALFRQYVDSRLLAYRKLPDLEAAKSELARSVQLQKVIWTRSVAACQTGEGQRASMLLLPALNQMFDIVNDRTASALTHPPKIIYGMLIALTLAGALFAGIGMGGAKTRSWVHIIGFATIMAASVYVIIDLEYPRSGLIRIDAVDQWLVDVRQSME
jgi:hypothetical protein